MSPSRQRPPKQGPATRRERRESAPPAASGAPGSPSGAQSIAWLTGGVVAVSFIVIGIVLALQPPTGGAAASASTAAGSGSGAIALDTSWVVTPTVLTPTADARGRRIGPDGAPVKLDVWADFQCPACKRFTELIEPQLVTDYIAGGRAQLVFHDLAFIGPESTQAAIGGLCAADQDRFWPYHDYVYANQGAENSGALADDRLEALAQAAGLDVAAFSTCLQSGTRQQDLQAELTQAQQLGIRSTPTLFVNGEQLPSAFDYPSVAAAIDAALAAASASSAP